MMYVRKITNKIINHPQVAFSSFYYFGTNVRSLEYQMKFASQPFYLNIVGILKDTTIHFLEVTSCFFFTYHTNVRFTSHYCINKSNNVKLGNSLGCGERHKKATEKLSIELMPLTTCQS